FNQAIAHQHCAIVNDAQLAQLCAHTRARRPAECDELCAIDDRECLVHRACSRVTKPEANESRQAAVLITVMLATSCVGSTSTKSIALTLGWRPHNHAARRASHGSKPPGRAPGHAGAKARS